MSYTAIMTLVESITEELHRMSSAKLLEVAHLRRKMNLHDALPSGPLLFTSMFTVGELEKGINRSAQLEKERAKVNLVMPHIAVLTPDEITVVI